MNNEKFNLVLDKLLERTEENKLEWKTTADKDTFLVGLKDSAISLNHLSAYQADDERVFDYYTFDFRNEDGDIAESITISPINDNQEFYEKAERIFDLARRQSLKIDKTFDRILEQLAA